MLGKTRRRVRKDFWCPQDSGQKGQAQCLGRERRDWGLLIRTEPTHIENLGSIPRGVGWKVKEVGDGSDDCSDLAGTGEARGTDVVVTGAGTAGFRNHPDEYPVADGKLRVATMAVQLGDAFFGGQSESSAGGLPCDEGKFQGLDEGVLNHSGVLDVSG